MNVTGTNGTRTSALIGALEQMLLLLERERAAVAAFQMDALARLTADKSQMLEQVAALSGAARGDERATATEKDHAVMLFQRMQQEGHANMLLLHSVGKILSAHMGMADDESVYNARARRQSAYAPRRASAY